MSTTLQNKDVAFKLLAFVEMWERFSYYGMRALLVLYLTSSLGFTDRKAYAIYSIFSAISYGVPIIGGVLADKLIGYQRTLVIGAIIMCVGHLAMTFAILDESYIYYGLALIATGTGFFKGNVTSLLGSIYTNSDSHQRDKAFSLFNVAINTGSLLASILCGYIAHRYGWHYGFGLAGIGMFLGLLMFVMCRHVLGGSGNVANQQPRLNGSPLLHSLLISFATSCVSLWLIYSNEASLPYLSLTVLLVFIVIFKMLRACNAAERRDVFLLFAMALFLIGFIAVEMQLGSLISLFIERNVNKQIFNYQVPAAMLQGLNPMFVIMFGCLFANAFSRYGYKFYMKRFALGLLVNIACFVFIFMGCLNSSNGKLELYYIIISMGCMSFAEICLFPVIQVLFCILSPQRFKGLMMGFLLFGLSYSNLASVVLSELMSIPHGSIGDPMASLAIYQEGFYRLMIFAILLLLTFVSFYPYLKRVVIDRSIESN